MDKFDAAKIQRQPKGIPLDVTTEVVKDFKRRAEIGEKKYGERLRPFNGRDAFLDAYQEAIDLVVYLKQILLEQDCDNLALAKDHWKEGLTKLLIKNGYDNPELLALIEGYE